MDFLEELMDKLGNKNLRTRQKAERELVKIGVPVIEFLIQALEDDNWTVRYRAASALGKIKDARAIEPLIQRFTDDQDVQICAAFAVGKIGIPALEPLIRALEDENWEVREGVVMALGKIGDLAAVDPLIGLLKNDCDNSVRWRAAIALGHIGDPRAVEPLIQALKDEDYLVRHFASSSLGHIGKEAVEPLLSALGDTDWETRHLAIRALGGIASTRVVGPIIRSLEDENMEVRLSSACALGNIGDVRAVQPLITALKDESMVVRLHAAETLGKIGDSSVIEPLLDALRDDKYAVREASAISITKLRDPVIGPILRKMRLRLGLIHNGVVRTRERKRFSAFIEPLSQALRKGNEVTRLAVALALSVIGGPRPIEPLIQALNNDKDKYVRMAAVGSLGRIGRASAIKALKLTLNDESKEVRSKALGALAFLRDTSAVEPLLQALRDEDKEVRWSAAEDLGHLGGGNRVAEYIIRAALENIEDDIKKEAAHALETMEEEKENVERWAEYLEA